MGSAHLRHSSGWGITSQERLLQSGAQKRVGMGGGNRSENNDERVDFVPSARGLKGLTRVSSLRANRWELQREDFSSSKGH